jgi:hypothetical protein
LGLQGAKQKVTLRRDLDFLADSFWNWAGTRLGFGLSRPKVQNFVQTRFRSEPLKPPVAEIET